MSNPLKYQLRVYLDDGLAEKAIRDADEPVLYPLKEVLRAHDARMVSQWQAFQDHVAEAEASGTETPLSRWTRATLADPAMRAKHLGAFALRIGDAEVYPGDAADALEADLQSLLGGGVVARISRHDTDPAKNIPVPQQYRS